MVPQAKILRVFQLIGLLKGGGRTVGQLASHLEATERTVYRYFKLLEEIGFIIDQDFNGRYFIHRDEGENPDDQFTLEEVSLLRQLVQKIGRASCRERARLVRVAGAVDRDNIMV